MALSRARYHPASLLIELPEISSTEFFRQYTQQEVHLRPDRYIDGHADFVHEYLHFMQMTGTAYGRFETRWRLYQISLLPELIRAIGSVPKEAWKVPPCLPLKVWWKARQDLESLLPDSQYDDLLRWQSIEAILAVLRGDQPVAQPESSLCHDYLGTLPDDQPVIECEEGHEHILGARALLESAAELAEYHARISMRATREVRKSLVKPLLGSVKSLIASSNGVEEFWDQLASSYVPIDDCLTRAPEHLMAERLAQLTKGQRMWLLPVVCELALSAPASASFTTLQELKTPWKDFHPGHRFLSILEELAEIMPDDPRLEEVGVYSQLVHDVCARRNWATPEELAKRAAVTPGLTQLEDYFFPRAAEARLANPFAFLQPYVRPEAVNVLLVFGTCPHIVFEDGYVAIGGNIPPPYPEVVTELQQVMWVEAFFDTLVRGHEPQCAFKTLGQACGRQQHSRCDDCLRSKEAPSCDVAVEKYTLQLGEDWSWIRSTC